ncbi:Cleft lip and palate transmembrane protein-like protein [Emericellopsis cladophorae]|uniref:Cleft lip and palate transmembrane protein-like protein n=1 Tax=Emericellopsis cladophorae TaxID=2686198 RepID=A0A9P9Y8Q5_9HYPO|nr:Cleft lip and palate transmembrane protein-like protein [Emericellopsis cladophorae]KAI6785055.1 Cleft lip and palate transmembrane protein-like protein [Emericellopsis cladophorae]
MADQVLPRRPANQAQAAEAGGGMSFNKLLLGGAVYFGLSFFMNWYTKKEQTGITVTDTNTGNLITVPSNIGTIPPYQFRPDRLNEGATYRAIPKTVAPIWAQDTHVDITVTLAPSFNAVPLSNTPEEYVVMQEKGFHINNYTDKRVIETTFPVPKAVQNNGTLWGHFYIGLPGSVLDPKQPGYDPGHAYHFAYPLTQYLPKKKIAKVRNLLDDVPGRDKIEEQEEEEVRQKGPIIANYYHPNASFAFVPDLGVKELNALPPAARHYLQLEASGARDGTGQNGWYYPMLFINTFWQLNSHMMLLNETVTELPLRIDLNNMASWKFQLLANIEFNSKESARQAAFGNSISATGDGSEIEMVKEIFIDTNPILLGITAFASIAHMFLEMLAFGSDIAHYRKKKDNVGISVRSILANVFMQTIIFLYLLDNQQNTSWMILGQQVIGILIEFWKITTVVDVRIRPSDGILPYKIAFEDKTKLTETEEKTKEYDEIAFKYMYYAAVPLLIAYGIYSLLYDSHKSWYSYIITTLVGSVYAYGFLMMVPSLYINYRLKSVAHMPGKAMMYKFLNTFIDDLFAFTIKMPLLHRLATFRDDIIFFIYLYQRYAYRIDYSRVNEFGQGGEDEAEDKIEAKGKELAAEKVEELEAKGKKVVEDAKAKATGADAGKAKKRK